MAWLKSLIGWRDWLPAFRWRIVALIDSADNVPRRLPRNGAFLIGPTESPKWIVFDCPCGRGHRVMLNTDRMRWPCWILEKREPLSLAPSIDSQSELGRCHYFIRDGKALWVRERHGRRSRSAY